MSTPESAMRWDDAAERLLDSLARMVPDTLRDLAVGTARQESEGIAAERGGEAVAEADVIRAWIRTTPPEQRNSLVTLIEQLGHEPTDFADDLQSVEGWEEDAEEDEPGK